MSKPQLRRFNSVIGASAHGGAASAAAAAALHKASESAEGALFGVESAAHRRRAALIAAMWLGAKLALMLTESLVMQVHTRMR